MPCTVIVRFQAQRKNAPRLRAGMFAATKNRAAPSLLDAAAARDYTGRA